MPLKLPWAYHGNLSLCWRQAELTTERAHPFAIVRIAEVFENFNKTNQNRVTLSKNVKPWHAKEYHTRAGIGALALTYVAAILPTVKVRAVADPDGRVSAKELALG